MSANRVISAKHAASKRIESFPYNDARYTQPLPEPGDDGDDSDTPLAAVISNPEEDARRLASVDQIIFEKMQQAERDALETARKGYEEGFASGEAEGRQFGESQYRTYMQRLDGHLGELSASLALNQQASKDELLALALAMGEYLAGRRLEDSTGTLMPLLDAVLASHPFPGLVEEAQAGSATAVTIYMNPKDLETLGAGSQLHPGVALREAKELSRGSVRAEASEGVLDASLEHRQARLLELVQHFREEGLA
jgi:flagellar biosynthesis/type III secretory pathway protein FliH